VAAAAGDHRAIEAREFAAVILCRAKRADG
jgi:hypothetical protein